MKPATVNMMTEYHTHNLYFTDGKTEAHTSLCGPMTFKSVFLCELLSLLMNLQQYSWQLEVLSWSKEK